jgi:hypothetical protein
MLECMEILSITTKKCINIYAIRGQNYLIYFRPKRWMSIKGQVAGWLVRKFVERKIGLL